MIIKENKLENKALVVDLDGTLYRINTFHYFIKFLILNAITRFKPLLLVQLCFALMMRPLTSHAKVKYSILSLLNKRNDIDYNDFVNSIASKKREIKFINESDFKVKLLATAAPLCYSKIIAEKQNFDMCLGTGMPVKEFDDNFENKKEVKKKNVLSYLNTQNIRSIEIFVTDHLDDMPLIRIAKKNYIVSPDKKMRDLLKQSEISFEVID